MAIAGSVAPVFRDGGYDATATYDFYHALIHNNRLCFCRQDGTIGHEPQEESDEYWFISLDGNIADASTLNGKTEEELSVGNALKLNGLTAEEFVSNDNLLINSDFRNPVNSSGATEWTSTGTTIDKWVKSNANATATLTDEGLVFTFTGSSYFQLMQEIINWENLLGKTITISAKANGTVYSKTLTLPATAENNIDTTELALPCGYIDLYKQTNQPNLQLRYIMSATVGSSITFEYIKLELGKVATPPTPPNKELEKLKCGIVECDVTMLPKTLSTSILEKALELPIGVYHYFMGGNNYTGTDLPHSGYKYGTATINKRNTEAIGVILWGSEGSALVPVQTFYNRNTATFDDWVAFNDGGNADTVGGLHASDFVKTSGGDISSLKILSENPSASEGGQLVLEKTPNSNLVGDVVIDNHSNNLRIYENGGDFRGANIDLTECSNVDGVRVIHTDNMKNYVLPLDGSVPMTGGKLTIRSAVFNVEDSRLTMAKYVDEDRTIRRDMYITTNNDFAEAFKVGTNASGSWVYKTLLHTGNSAAVVVSASAPSNTSALWYDTTNKILKHYVDGAWQA